MALTINTNISAMVAQRNLNVSNARSTASLEKLSSGSRVPNAKADAAALAIGTGLRGDVAALEQAKLNAQQGVSVLQIADGAYSNITDILMRMKSLSSQSLSDQVSDNERSFLNTEYQQLLGEIDRIAGATEFNGNALLGGQNAFEVASIGSNVNNDAGFVAFKFDNAQTTDAHTYTVHFDSATNQMTIYNSDAEASQTLTIGTIATGATQDYNFSDLGVTVTLSGDFNTGADIGAAGGTVADNSFKSNANTTAAALTLNFQVGIGTTSGAGSTDQISIQIDLGNTTALGVAGGDILNAANARTASDAIDDAIDSVNTARAELGAFMNRLEFAANNISVAIENVEAARSSMLDVDVASEITRFTSEQVLIQAGVSMLAQANQQPSQLLRLLQ